MTANNPATKEVPPNNHIFDLKSLSQMNPILAKRKADQDASSTSANTSPVFNISLGEGVANILRSLMPSQQPQQPAANFSPYSTPAYTENNTKSLLHPSRLPGLDMPTSDFCKTYLLSSNIEKRLTDHGYTHARMLRFIQVDELKEMEYRMGEIACLKDAVEQWSSPVL